MIIRPKIRGYICTTAHPVGCAASVKEQIEVVRASGSVNSLIHRVLVLGASGGYGLASRITAAFGCGAATLGISYEKPPSADKTTSAGWYNNVAFEEAARAAGLYAKSLDGDAFSDEMKARAVDLIRSEPVHIKSLNVERGVVLEVDFSPASEEEARDTVAVMGGEDWEFWVEALLKEGLLSHGFRTLAYTYIGSELTWPIYWGGTLGKAKEDLDRAALSITTKLAPLDGLARVATLKAIVSQASAAIPAVPLYASLLFRVMKEAGRHETIIEHVFRLFATQLAEGARLNLDAAGRIRYRRRGLCG